MGPEKDCAPINTMISTPPPSPPLPGSPRLRGCHVPCPAAPPCSPCPSPRMSPRNSSCPVGAPLYPPRSGLLGLPDPQRRHSWDPGAAVLGYLQYEDLSVSMGDLNPEEIEKLVGGALGRLTGRDPRRAPITNYAQDFGSLLSLTEEEVAPDPPRFSLLEEQSSQLQGCSASAPSLCDPLAESRSQSSATCPWPRPQPRTYSHYNETSLYSVVGGSTQRATSMSLSIGCRPVSPTLSVDAGSELGSLDWGTEERTEGQQGGKEEREEKTGSPLGRTLSFLRKMAGTRKNKEKERMKEREKEAREREARYSNGHLFTSLTVSGTTLCSACNKSITAKEALSCPTCNVTIHNRCRDTLPNCAKMKQRQQKLALVRNSSALQNVALRTKSPMLKERPSSAIYPSDLRQSLLGTRRGRSGLSLSKSVSTNNIAGILSQSTDSLNFRNRAMSMESLNDEGEVYYASMLEELEREGRDFEVDSWSTAVDSSYLQAHRKDVIKRQDVIYELIQTELHHVRTLRIMDGVFRRGMLEEVMLEPGVAHAVFPCLDRLLSLHSRFLAQLLLRRNHSLAPGSTNNFTIDQLGDLLQEQFSGQNADEMRKAYAEFCSRHLKAVKLYKELLARDKRFQYFIRRVSRGPLLRRHGVQECILLVTQRITKYPVLIQRILDNTKGNEEEASSLRQSLVQIRELLSSVDQQVLELERTQRLQEIRARLDPRAETEVRGGGVFRGGELLRRGLIHEGTLLWKTAGSRLKDVQVLLMTDILVFMQEKDQKFIFPCLDKPAVLSLKNLIVRDIANQERGMFLISDSTPPEMYEIHAASKDDRNTWMRLIQQTVSCCPSREDFPLIETEDKALLRRLRADIQQKDREVLELLQERVTLFSDLAEVTSGQEVALPHNPRNLFRADTPQAPQAEKLLTEAITEVDKLSELLLGSSLEVPLSCSSNGDQNHTVEPVSNGDEISVNGTHDQNSPVSKDKNGNQLQDRPPNEEVCQRLVNLSAHLHALQATVIKQDSIVELSLWEGPCSTPTTPVPLSSAPAKLCRSMSRDAGLDASAGVAPLGELALLQRQHSLLQEELVRLRVVEGRLKDSEKARVQLEKQVKDLKAAPVDGAGLEQAHLQNSRGEGEPNPVAPLASEETVDQLDGLQESSDVDDNSDDDDDDDVRISPRSDSPRDLQDIPEESECGADLRETEADCETHS
ncbi:rho guanine nucleotide exchange factor 2-like isoform X3 [Anguilla anguilla]|uniref:rho guanine nucleotide exchange factor 2-like isoform X3 n=1 Tax=Anguilla anguilla TaxID=7936 RepID=UPI0015AE77B7|nr:rho guanine nucleotide exchange factor 2-like isoform X3 [Anguilla anguilla]